MLELSNKRFCFNAVILKVNCWFFGFDEEHFINETIQVPMAFLEDCKLVTEIFVLQIVYIQQVFTNDGMLMFINVLKKVSACIAHITCITRITFIFINTTLFVDKRWFEFCDFDLICNFLACINTGRKWLLIFFTRSESCLHTKPLITDLCRVE